MAEQREQIQVLEHGNIYFLFKPRVEQHEPGSAKDIQQFYMLLSPQGKSKRDKNHRLAVIGREQLPDPGAKGRSRYWGFVDAVSHNGRELAEGLTEQEYETKTRGTRHQPAARPAGEGVYQLLRHGDHTHLIYALELPQQLGEVQRALNIEAEASYIISIRNPEAAAPVRTGLPKRERAQFPNKLQDVFRQRKFADADPPELLDYEGAEFVLIAASENPEQELGAELEAAQGSKADIFRDLRLRKSEHPLEPLFKGEWS